MINSSANFLQVFSEHLQNALHIAPLLSQWVTNTLLPLETVLSKIRCYQVFGVIKHSVFLFLAKAQFRFFLWTLNPGIVAVPTLNVVFAGLLNVVQYNEYVSLEYQAASVSLLKQAEDIMLYAAQHSSAKSGHSPTSPPPRGRSRFLHTHVLMKILGYIVVD
jgi:hypothetical protein